MEMESPSAAIGIRKYFGGEDQISTLVGLNAAAWLILLGASFMLTIPSALKYERSSSLTLLDGKLAHDFEKYVTSHHPYRDVALNSWTALELSLFKAGKPGVVIGNDDWLFTLEEMPLPSSRDKQLAINLERVRSTVDTLRKQGIETIVVPVPAKAELYRDHLAKKFQHHILKSELVTDYLTKHGISWVPIKPMMEEARSSGTPVFFRAETHWTPEGARVAANGIAAWLATHGKSTWHTTPFEVAAPETRVLESDLESYLPLKPHFGNLLPKAETYRHFEVTRSDTSSGSRDLFGSSSNPVALVGTSYSADPRWNFAGWLRMQLGTEIDNVSEKAKGPFAPMEKFLELHEKGQTGAQLVIWEIPVRGLAANYSPQKHYSEH